MEDDRSEERRNTVLLIVAGIALLALMGYGLYSMMGGTSGKQPRPPKISLLPSTPPPPPPPPKEERKPEPPKEQKEVRMEQPEMKQAPAPEAALKMEGEKGEGPSVFQSGKVTNENVIPRVGGGDQFAFYSNFMKKYLQDELARNRALAGKEYRVSVTLWLDSSGRIEKFNLTRSSGNPQTDALIRSALNDMPPMKAPPDSMPRPVGVHISSRG